MTDDSPVVLPDDPSLGPEVQVDYPGYRSTRYRAPDRPLVTLPEEFHALAGPVYGEDAVSWEKMRHSFPNDLDLARDLESRSEREGRCRGVEPQPAKNVREVEPGGADRDGDLAGSRRPRVELLYPQDLRAASPRDDDAVRPHDRRRLLRK